MISLEPQIALALLTVLVTALGSFFAVKASNAENTRLLKALHARFDRVEGRVSAGEIRDARLDERVKAIERQRLRTTARLTPQDMFPEGDQG